MARMVTRSMKAKGNYCIRFPYGLPNKKVNPKKLKQFMDRERVNVVYRNSPLYSKLAAYITFLGALFSYTYCFVLYIYLFIYIRRHPLSVKENQLMIA